MSRACGEAALYRDCGVHGLIIENMHDAPYLNGGLGPEVTACMTRVTAEVRRQVPGLALGVQILSGKFYNIAYCKIGIIGTHKYRHPMNHVTASCL